MRELAENHRTSMAQNEAKRKLAAQRPKEGSRQMRTALALLLWTGVALAQNSFPTANGSRVEGVVMMCLTAGKAVPCTGTVTARPRQPFQHRGRRHRRDGLVQMCLAAGKAVPCTGTVTTGPDSSFTTPGNARVSSIVLMCITGGKAVPCTGTVTTGPDGSFTTPRAMPASAGPYGCA